MTWNKLFVAVVATMLVSVALPAGAYHIDHHDGDTTSVTWIAGTALTEVCERENHPDLQEPHEGQGGLCYAHNHTITSNPGSVGPATDTSAGAPDETTLFGHHTGSAHGADGHADHGVYDQDESRLYEPDDSDDDTTQDGGHDIGIPRTNAGCGQIGDAEWTALNVTIGTDSHQTEAFLPAFWFGQISGVQGATTNVTEHLVYHEKTACLATDGHVEVFIDALASTFGGDTMGSYTTWGQGEKAPCEPGDRVCATTSGASPT